MRYSLIERLENRLLLSSQPYVWQNANIGGGGFVDGIFYSPTQPNVIYARTDIGGLYKTTNDGTNWSELLDFAGGADEQQLGVLSFAIDPENANNIYADTGEYTTVNGWVLYSTNGGQTFNQTDLPFYVGGNENGRGTGERLAVDPNDGSILFLGSNNDGLWESTNGAASFSKVSSFPSAAGADGITFVTFDPTGAKGSPSQTIYVGVNFDSAGSNIYQTTNGGTTWTELTGTGAPTGFIPMQCVVAAGGNVYFTFANALPPSGDITNGAVYRYTPASTAWDLISPQVPGGSNPAFGYDGIAVDPENPDTVVVTSFHRYASTDEIWRTTDGNAATPTWVELYDTSSAQNFGFGGFDTTRNTSAAPWIAEFGDGIGNWAASVAINPFNSSQLMYGTGQGLWATNDATSTTELSGPNSWYFPDTGIEFTSVKRISAGLTGVPIFSAMDDINGFAQTTLTLSPAAGSIDPGAVNGSMTWIDVAGGADPEVAAIVGIVGTEDGAYSTNDGATWTEFASNPGGTGGSVAVSANGSTIVWDTAANGVFYSTNDGASWTASTGAPGTGSVYSDRVNPNYFYYQTTANLYVSNNGGVSFTEESAGGGTNLAPNFQTAGDLWAASASGLFHSTNNGATFSQVASGTVTSATEVALGKAAPGQSYPAIYIYGTIGGVTGAFRSDDDGSTWVSINDSAQQFGSRIQTLAADPNIYGRLYMGINGRGIEIGDPANALPAGWSDTDINTPGNFGYSTNSETLSNGTTVNDWIVNGGGAGLGALSSGDADQFNFASESVSGNATISAQLLSLSNANGTGGGTPEAGVMFRASTGVSDPFVALMQTTGNQLIIMSRSTTGGTITSQTPISVPVGAEYIEIVRVGNVFTAEDSTNGTIYTPIGSPVTISAMPTAANVGLAATADFNSQLTAAVFANVNVTSSIAPVAPQVTNVVVDGSAWAAAFNTYLGTLNPLNVNGYSIPTGSAQATTLPWTNLNQISITFSQNVTVTEGDLTLSGVNVPTYAFSGFSYNSTTDTATWTVNQSIPDDKLALALSDAVTNGSSTPLAGAWVNGTSTYPSGVGGAASNFDFDFNVLPGDTNQSGGVNILDSVKTQNLQGSSTTTPATYSIFCDVNGSGGINVLDSVAVRARQGSALPAGTPAVAAVGVVVPALSPLFSSVAISDDRVGQLLA